jgi:hypothetical protein
MKEQILLRKWMNTPILMPNIEISIDFCHVLKFARLLKFIELSPVNALKKKFMLMAQMFLIYMNHTVSLSEISYCYAVIDNVCGKQAISKINTDIDLEILYLVSYF